MPLVRRGETSAAPLKHETVRWVKHSANLFWRRLLRGTYVRGREKAGVIGCNGHFCAVIARLIEDPLLELYKYIWILLKSGIQVPNMILWLRSRAINPCDGFPAFLLKIVGLKFE